MIPLGYLGDMCIFGANSTVSDIFWKLLPVIVWGIDPDVVNRVPLNDGVNHHIHYTKPREEARNELRGGAVSA